MTNNAGRRALEFALGRGARRAMVAVSMIASVMVTILVSHQWGGAAAAAEGASEHSAAGGPDAHMTDPHVMLAGRWTGSRGGWGRAEGEAKCGGKPCALTFDIVACGEGWCGIAVSADNACGAIGLRLHASKQNPRPTAFGGKLELAKGSAPYTVEAWYAAPSEGGKAHLGVVGDTGGELLMMRRSFPLHAEFERISDATCTLEKATS